MTTDTRISRKKINHFTKY